MKYILSVTISVAVFSMLFMSCDLFQSTVYVKFDQETFNEQRQLWQISNVKNYQYDFSAVGFSSYCGTIFVEDGNFKNDLPSEGNSYIEYFINYSTIDEVYKKIEGEFFSYNNTKQSLNDFYYTEILVEYDKMNHIPTSIKYKWKSNPMVAVDGTFDYSINNFSNNE
jgi:hypothetical protein